jgi:N-acetyl-gamma-glutamyl-phosphate reductase
VKKNATLVANPGCYVTSVLMALIPLFKEGVIEASSVVIDAKSGTSGAGKKAAENLLFTEVEGECLPYKIGKHQHFPEITHYANFLGATAASGSLSNFDPMFSTTLLPVRRGIISGIFAKLKPGKKTSDVAAAYAKAYEGYPLVRFGESTDPQALSLKRVVGSARTHIRYTVDGEKLYLNSLIDNLMKGAASQAVENFNLLVGLSPETSLLNLEGTL